MNQSNFSLISALYNSGKDNGLYKDIYFPIIKYSIVSLFYEEKDKEYLSISNIYDYINTKFGLAIPSMVLQKVICAISEKKGFDIDIYEDGEYFKIKKAFDYQVNIDIDKKAEELKKSLQELEDKFKVFKEEKAFGEDVSFLQFISDNCDDILGYFQNEDSSKVDEKYVVVAEYLLQLKDCEEDLYKTANQLFWGSIIAGFLKRENPSFTQKDTDGLKEYYLDTSIILALLDLSTENKTRYAKEMLQIIVSSGGTARVHPMTLKEIRIILENIENAGSPRENADIADAYNRKGLSLSNLVSVRTHLEELVEKEQISIFPNLTQDMVNTKIRDYVGSKLVCELAENRGKQIFDKNSEKEQFREIHDVYLVKFIEKHRTKVNRQGISFVTLNKDLVAFAKTNVANYDKHVIHPEKIIIELWMHNAISSVNSTYALVETLMRTQFLQDDDVKHKLSVVSKYFNKEIYDKDTYKALIFSLVKREKNVISYIDEVEENEKNERNERNTDLIHSATKEAVEFVAVNEERIKKVEGDNDKLSAQLEMLTQSNSTLLATIQEINNNIYKTNEENDRLKKRLYEEEENKEVMSQKVGSLEKKTNNQERTIKLLNEEKSLSNIIQNEDTILSKLEEEKKASICMFSYYFPYVLNIIIIILSIGLTIRNWNDIKTSFSFSTLISYIPIAPILSILLTIFKSKEVIKPHIYKKEIIAEQIKSWEEDHPEYKEKIESRKRNSERMSEIQKELKKSDIQ